MTFLELRPEALSKQGLRAETLCRAEVILEMEKAGQPWLSGLLDAW
jgi:hypothetical protein